MGVFESFFGMILTQCIEAALVDGGGQQAQTSNTLSSRRRLVGMPLPRYHAHSLRVRAWYLAHVISAIRTRRPLRPKPN